MRKYAAEKEIGDVVRSFETATISRGDWKHREHLTVALYYLSNNDFDEAYRKMRGGIFKLLRAFEVDLSKEMPYHETLTIFWLKTVENFLRSGLKSNANVPFAVSGASRVRVKTAAGHGRGTRPILTGKMPALLFKQFPRTANGYSTVEIYDELTKKFDKDYPFKFYTRERLFSDEARTKYIEGEKNFL